MGKSEHWMLDHSHQFLACMRIALGMMLFSKGLHFISNPQALVESQVFQELPYASLLLAHVIIIAHIAGGLLIAVGLLTRLAVLIQLPILVGALIFVKHNDGSILTQNASWHFTLWILLMLFIFGLYGSGCWSADEHIFKDEPGETDDEKATDASVQHPRTPAKM
jgi:uncharacterized membrane protein YphA (DoxX/SURF4 family)